MFFSFFHVSYEKKIIVNYKSAGRWSGWHFLISLIAVSLGVPALVRGALFLMSL